MEDFEIIENRTRSSIKIVDKLYYVCLNAFQYLDDEDIVKIFNKKGMDSVEKIENEIKNMRQRVINHINFLRSKALDGTQNKLK